MRVVVIGATGNVGTSTLTALAASEEVGEIVGVARRLPRWRAPKTRWQALDITSGDIAAAIDGADAVVHLAWAIQPSRDDRALRDTNVLGTERVLEAVARARVPALVYASSVGAYSPVPAERYEEPVDESHPTGGIATSFYSRHKAATESMLDRFQADQPGVRVVRLRPALIFKREAAAEIRRLFAGPFLPGFALRPGRLPFVPVPAGLRMQAVHSLDVGVAYARAVTSGVAGAFNIAAEPVLRRAELGEILGARPFTVPVAATRALAAASWRLRLQPTPPGWLDMAMGVPLLDTTRARSELGWAPERPASEALAELLHGLADGAGMETPPLDRHAGGPMRLRELATGVGARV